MEIPPAILHPFFFQITWSDGGLAEAGADGSLRIDPIGIRDTVDLLTSGNIIQLRGIFEGRKAVPAPDALILQFDRRLVSNLGRKRVIDEGTIDHQVDLFVAIGKALKGILEGKFHPYAAVRRQRRGKLIDIKSELVIF